MENNPVPEKPSTKDASIKPTIYEFPLLFRLRIIAVDEASGLEQAKKQILEKMGLPLEYIEQAFKDGLSLNKRKIWDPYV